MRNFPIYILSLLLGFTLAACQQDGDERPNGGNQAAPQNQALANNYYGSVNNIPCGDTRTSTYTQATAVAVVVEQTSTGG